MYLSGILLIKIDLNNLNGYKMVFNYRILEGKIRVQ